MTATITNNGPARQRRRLDDSIGRMDQMIDGLAEAIPGTIKDVLEQQVSTAISEGIKGALLEILTNPELANMMRGVFPPTPPSSNQGPGAPLIIPLPRPSLLRKVARTACETVGAAARWGREKVLTAGQTVAETANAIATKLTTIRQRLWILRYLPRSVVLALGVGALTAVVALGAPNGVIVSLGATVLAGVAHVGLWVRRRFNAITLASD